MKNNPILKLTVVTLIGILGLWLIYTLLFGGGYGVNYNYNGYHGGGHMYMGTGLGFGSTAAIWILLLIKVLFAAFVISLIVGLIIWIKNNIFTAEDVQALKDSFKGNNNPVCKETCTNCNKELNSDWKVCPHCGKEKITIA